MALVLEQDDQVLVCTPTGKAVISLTSGHLIPLEVYTVVKMAPRYQRGAMHRRTTVQRALDGKKSTAISVAFGTLPPAAQKWYKKQVDIAHKELVKRTPKQEIIKPGGLIPTALARNGNRVRVPVPIRYRDVPRPQKPKIDRNTSIKVAPSIKREGKPAFRVGLPLSIIHKDGDRQRTFDVGEIAGFDITPSPRSS